MRKRSGRNGEKCGGWGRKEGARHGEKRPRAPELNDERKGMGRFEFGEGAVGTLDGGLGGYFPLPRKFRSEYWLFSLSEKKGFILVLANT